MSDPQAQLATPRRGHQQSNHSLSDSTDNQGNRHCSVSGENVKLMETEKSYSILSFNWKEENLLKKKLSFLESMKKYEANARLMEQKVFYKRCHSKLQRAELAHARLLGNKDLVKRLTSRNNLSTYTSTSVDESEAAVRAIVQNRGGWEKSKLLLGLSLDKDKLYPPLGRGLLSKVEAQMAPRTLKAGLKEENMRESVVSSTPKREDKPIQDSPEWTAQQKMLPVASRPSQEGQRPTRDSSSKPPSSPQSHLQDPATGKTSKGKLLKYLMYGDRSVRHPKKKRPRPRNNLHSSEKVQIDLSQPVKIEIMKQRLLMSESAKYLEARVSSLFQPTHFQDYSSSSLLEKGSEGGLYAAGIRTYGVVRGQKIILEEIGKHTKISSTTRKNRHPFY